MGKAKLFSKDKCVLFSGLFELLIELIETLGGPKRIETIIVFYVDATFRNHAGQHSYVLMLSHQYIREQGTTITHIDLQVINAPKLAQSQSLGLQAKDWGIRCVRARGYYRVGDRWYWLSIQLSLLQNRSTVKGC